MKSSKWPWPKVLLAGAVLGLAIGLWNAFTDTRDVSEAVPLAQSTSDVYIGLIARLVGSVIGGMFIAALVGGLRNAFVK